MPHTNAQLAASTWAGVVDVDDLVDDVDDQLPADFAADPFDLADRLAILEHLAQLTDATEAVMRASSDAEFDEATAECALAWHRTLRTLDAARPVARRLAPVVADKAIELRQLARRQT